MFQTQLINKMAGGIFVFCFFFMDGFVFFSRRPLPAILITGEVIYSSSLESLILHRLSETQSREGRRNWANCRTTRRLWHMHSSEKKSKQRILFTIELRHLKWLTWSEQNLLRLMYSGFRTIRANPWKTSKKESIAGSYKLISHTINL